MWRLKTTTMPLIVGTQGMIKKGTDKYLNKIPGGPNLYEMQNIALCGTVHFLRRVTLKYHPKEAAKRNINS